ncbi:MAG TPA: energy transducer TonB [Verrucomicrobiae bacterium]|nr:energy transducer TonB [Verrucomicrobiae bacterium]
MLLIFYAVALAFHAVVLFCLKPPATKPPKIFNETYVDVTLTTPPPPQPEPKPIVVPPPKPVVLPPKPEEKPQPMPPPKPEMTIPEPKPEPPPPVPKPVAVPPLQPKPPTEEYVPVTQPTFVKQAEHIYPSEAARRHQQGVVVLMLYINGSGALDKIEIVKSSGYPLLDAAAIREMKLSKFEPAMDGAIPIRSRAQASVTYRLE